jgi:hypothetical protein
MDLRPVAAGLSKPSEGDRTMSGHWSYRLVQNEENELHFAWVRFRPEESSVSGIITTGIKGANVKDMRQLANALLTACDQGIIGPDGEDPDYERDDEEEDAW